MAQMFFCGSEGCCGSTSFVAIQRVRSGLVALWFSKVRLLKAVLRLDGEL